MAVFAAYSISLLEEKDALALAALESICFSMPWNEEQYRLFLRHGREDAERRRALHQAHGGIVPAGVFEAAASGNTSSAVSMGALAGEGLPRESVFDESASSPAGSARLSLCDASGNALLPFVLWGVVPVLGMHDASGELAAYLSLGLHYAAGEMEVYNIASAPRVRRQGLATRLLTFALREAGSAGMERAVLEVRIGNAPALALYRRLGFSLCGRRKNYYTDSGEDALVLECLLPLSEG